MQDWELKLYKIYRNGGPGMTFTYFTIRSYLVAFAFKCE